MVIGFRTAWHRLRRLLLLIAGAVALVAGLALPLLIWQGEYWEMEHWLTSEANIYADRVSEIVSYEPDLWRYLHHRIETALQPTTYESGMGQIQVHDQDGLLIFTQGDAPLAPHMSRQASLEDSFEVVGKITVTGSLRPVLRRTAMAAVSGILLAALILFTLWRLPLRVLSRTLGELEATGQELRASQRELRALNEELEVRIAERTAELRASQDELVRKQRLAAIGQLTATVSHELRNPLGSIRNALAVIQRLADEDNPMMNNSMKIAERGISRCDNIITELLDFSRVRNLNWEITDIDAWLGEVLDTYEHTPDIKLARELEAGVEIPCDRERLLRVVLNVLDNGCQAVASGEGTQGPARKPWVTVTTRLGDRYVEIVIADNGPGMSAEQQKKVFEPLFSTKSFGVGLGLPMVKQIMEQHGVSVTIDSEVGQGTQMRLLLPLRQEQVTE